MATLNWVGTTATYATNTNWIDQATGLAPAAGPTAADDIRYGVGTGASTTAACTWTTGNAARSLTIDNAYTGTITVGNVAASLSIGDGSGGAVSIGTGVTFTLSGASSTLTLAATSTNGGAGWPVTINLNPCTLRVRANNASGRWALQGDVTFASLVNVVRLSAGLFDFNNKNPTFVAGSPAFIVDGGTAVMGTGTFTYQTTNTATIFSYTSGTITGGSETHSLTGAGNNVRTFGGGGQTYGALAHNGASGTGALAATGANTFTSLANVSGRTVTLPASTTTTVSGANGLGGIKGTLNSSTGGTAATVSLTSTQVSVMRAATLKDITVTPNGHAYALDASVSTSGNTGVTFNTPFGWGVAA